jgi:hypothetical protein
MKNLLAVILLISSQVCQAQSCSKTSPNYKNTLVELFTSDGCDSCPPANKWLSELIKKKDPGVVPLSMHVTYWNKLGWIDRFSDRIFDERQAGYARNAQSKFSYTPEFFANGAEWRSWRNEQALIDVVSRNSKTTAPVEITLKAEHIDRTDEWIVNVSIDRVSGYRGAAELFLVLYEDNLATDIKAGENRGAVLRHDHVARKWIGPIEISGMKSQHQQKFVLEKQWNPLKSGVAAFVQGKPDGDILQALDLPLCNV